MEGVQSCHRPDHIVSRCAKKQVCKRTPAFLRSPHPAAARPGSLGSSDRRGDYSSPTLPSASGEDACNAAAGHGRLIAAPTVEARVIALQQALRRGRFGLPLSHLHQSSGHRRRGAHRASVPRSGLLQQPQWLQKAFCSAVPKAPLCKGGPVSRKADWRIVNPSGASRHLP